VPDQNHDFPNAQRLHDFYLVLNDGAIAHGEKGLREFLAKGRHSTASASSENGPSEFCLSHRLFLALLLDNSQYFAATG
jgi:hypothetical protein